MFKSTLLYTCLLFYVVHVQSMPLSMFGGKRTVEMARGVNDWRDTLSDDTRHRLDLAKQHLQDQSTSGQAFRNDTIMRINIEREALDLSLIDLEQAFGMELPAPRAGLGGKAGHKRSSSEDLCEEAYLRGGTMTSLPTVKRSNAQDLREQAYLRGGTMTSLPILKRNDAQDLREEAYLRSGSMTSLPISKRDNNNNNNPYTHLLNRHNLALGALERINIAHRVLHKPEITSQRAQKITAQGDEYVAQYWASSMNPGGFWTEDQMVGRPNFVQGGQTNGVGFTQSTFHRLHCLANIRMMLAWHITGNGKRMTREMNVHTIHCLEYIRWRELVQPDLTEEPIDTVDYMGMGIH
ncbi:hypothetical protein Purlil1_7773 [Purpureocillium lilacinum]|uniref:Uncharacterized protein n=1 Tax=Purpureocillium lilacinum TaxID=33203 RepID=A0ABR0BVJ6_PURLI|nr:hypothetical protein Purlil1_7773 [Purpureocillium lilacinum]